MARGAEAVEQRLEMEGGGSLTVEPEGVRVRLTARRPADGRGLYKVWLHGERGGKFLLGTLAPEGEQLELRRALPVGELERAGCWPRFRARAVLAFPFGESGERGWYCEAHPERLLADPVLRGQTGGPMLCRRGEGGFSLAAPFRTNCPAVLEGALLLARAERWSSGLYLIWDFDAQGRPVLPPAGEKGGGRSL